MKTRIAIAALVLLALAQLVPVSRTNPPVETEIPAGPDVLRILRRSCYDCHSNESRWPWYAYVAPSSWLVVHDVHEARDHLNFTTWNAYDAKQRAHRLEHLWEEVNDGDMPLWYYLPFHPDARLSEADKRVLHDFAVGKGS